ncbi:type VII secretion protein EccB [Mangrovihabitans endophyticus]|uniref:Type VII secretion protein EccB n=1 Tax=Mangrovihabitans endophyticus TaxID=1751298 RepID=A0A8J3C0Z8_9ACTN|nr:type VII secretion protein EccB [Mangrovihabitans endophyticus]GGK99578.1 type VII secretion protein EccB [Mangrovihabitans endophyticus]
MWTQRDQLQAYQFLRRRIVSALQFGDANHPVAPGRRLIRATAAGLGVALLVTGGFLVAAVLHPGSTADWRSPGQILVEKETGASFVLGDDGLVHPVLNHASARLLIGSAKITSMSSRALADAPRGRPLGIPGAPASLAAPDALITGPWAVCTTPGDAAALTTAVVGASLPAARLNAGQGVVVRDPDGARYLVSDGRRLRARTGALVALGYDAVRPRPAGSAWIRALPAGPDLTLLDVAGVGRRGPRLAGASTRVGQILLARGVDGADRYYLVGADGLVPVGQTEAALILGNPDNRDAYRDGVPRPVDVAAADVAASGLVATRAKDPGFPPRLPRITPGEGPVCAGGSGTGPLALWTGPAPVPSGARALPVEAPASARTADRVYVAPGADLLVRAGGGGTALITDQGTRYPVAGPDDLKALGYGDATVTSVTTGLLSLFPAGPELSRAAARGPA